jgi:hypothetical protein
MGSRDFGKALINAYNLRENVRDTKKKVEFCGVNKEKKDIIKFDFWQIYIKHPSSESFCLRIDSMF